MRYTYLKAISETLMMQMSSGHSEKRTMCFTHKKSCRCNQSNYCEQCFFTSENWNIIIHLIKTHRGACTFCAKCLALRVASAVIEWKYIFTPQNAINGTLYY